ncbi:MAG: hypothetical protein ACLQB4_01965 [Beijerinckiaceae bacterium]
MNNRRTALALFAAVLLASPQVAAASLETLLRAYPDQLAGYDETDLIRRGGTFGRLRPARRRFRQ